ncbi:MAG: hypothetical protein OZSIB_4038 [Candidatus Ozemobacter sibiricus]|jgi:Tfp pilus assembly protein PilX|uniref:Uncharacterized protein n=1 Tax=Candidatus Ozemobacter sibiricus TaxID=2268124 RepID=A0A367ZP21_9BACT|nr:MAG: hypothetical protein OZSIB_4038 [Candidatus Ozemobacter sibiricus]
MAPDRRGSIFLMALTALTVLFILGFSITFFTGSEDWSSAISYESEVAFNLAESAVEEFVARLKNSLNHDDPNNQLYKVLRSHQTKVDEEIPLDAAQVARLTTYTRETARQLYGIQFGQGLISSRDFEVSGVLKLKHINAVEATAGNTKLYTIKKDLKEKQGELTVTARVTYRGKTARVTLVFLIRVVKSFVPPFNYFTLFVKDGTIFGGSFFNPWKSNVGEQQKNLYLDNGWTSIPGQQNFDAIRDLTYWEKALALDGSSAQVPPGRVYLGQDPSAQLPPSIILQSTNGTKLLTDHPSDGASKFSQINGQENFFLKFDVDWMGLKDYVKKFMALQGQEKTKEGWLFTGWDNDTKIRIRNVGAGYELVDNKTSLGEPTFVNAMQSYNNFRTTRIKASRSSDEARMMERLYPEVDKSGLDLFGFVKCVPPLRPSGGTIDSKYLSPTLVYGPVWRMYYRIVTIEKNNQRLELPFIGTEPPSDGSPPLIPLPPGVDRDKKLNATEAAFLFEVFGVPKPHVDNLAANWNALPDGLTQIKKFEKFMSNSGVEPYNMGLGNFIQRINDKKDVYSGPLEAHLLPFLANEPYPGMPGALTSIVNQSPMREFYEGDLWWALPDEMSAYLMDFYFIPRSTEDFFRGRTTISIGGTSYDRFDFKYINDVRAYLSGAKNQTLELNGILALNDADPLVLRNLNFRGKGVIYSSPMMGGGPVIISGDFMPYGAVGAGGAAAATGANPNRDMITIVAPQILIDTTSAQSDPCYVEANLISVLGPLIVRGTKSVRIKGSVVCPRLNLEETFRESPGGVIIYNPLNSIWRRDVPALMDEMYVAKIVTGGVGRFEWKFEHD